MAILEDLAPDVLFLVLIRAPTIQIMWGFIRSCPRIYAVFRDQRDRILSAVITREIGRALLCEARAALRSSRLDPRGHCIAQALEWIAAYQKLYIVTHISHDDIARNSNPARQYDLDDLSATERMKLYRSLYRYIIYGNLFYFEDKRNEKKPKSSRTSFTGAYDQSHLFLNLFPAWQVKELSCFNDFMHDKIMEKWQEVEENFYEAIAANPLLWDVDRPLHETRCDSDIFFSPYFAVLRLSELREIFAAKDADLECAVQKHAGHLAHDFLDTALDEEPYHSVYSTPEFEEHQKVTFSGMKIEFEGDYIDKQNEAWLWAHDFRPCNLYVEPRSEFEMGEGLRRFGYIVWDSGRLHDSGLLSKSPSEVAAITLKGFPRPKLPEESVGDRVRELARLKKNTGS
ncbi:hypothetical protein N431DRAFT_514826 [Stipitochalara longipes BDJ]|nr:hypothetical protein N431DRAFT_514826 [Stipitochalara longipes BDJ]